MHTNTHDGSNLRADAGEVPESQTQKLGPRWQDPMMVDLLEEHATVLKRLNSKRRELKRFEGEVESMRVHMATLVAPLDERGRRLDDAVHGLFEKILNNPRRGKSTRAEIEAVYQNLQLSGTLSPRTIPKFEFETDAHEHGFDDGPFEPEFEPGSNSQAGDRGAHGHVEEQPAQVHRGRGEDKKNLRAMFLKLAAVLHPDKAKDDRDEVRRTELMKDLNRAYRDGDVARILEIEEGLQIGAELNESSEDELERRRRVLKTQIGLLVQRYKEVLHDLKMARRSELGESLIELRRLKRTQQADAYEVMLAPLAESLESLQGLHDFVELFAKGKMKVADFLRGPGAADEDEDVILTLEAMMGATSSAGAASHDAEVMETMMQVFQQMAAHMDDLDGPPSSGARSTSKSRKGAKKTGRRRTATRR